ncbi:MAG: hypothetical protein LUG50_15185 [Planctomycetaceae bacterium]|nr:hypothetical protein [Planctomycetaceae bacterium]
MKPKPTARPSPVLGKFPASTERVNPRPEEAFPDLLINKNKRFANRFRRGLIRAFVERKSPMLNDKNGEKSPKNRDLSTVFGIRKSPSFF